MTKLWEADQSAPREPSSLDILLRFLRMPEKRQLWKTCKMTVAREVDVELKTHGIIHRSPAAVYYKIRHLEDKCETMSRWLKTERVFEEYHRGAAPKNVQQSVQQRCPRYDQLFAIFHQAEIEDQGILQQSEQTPISTAQQSYLSSATCEYDDIWNSTPATDTSTLDTTAASCNQDHKQDAFEASIDTDGFMCLGEAGELTERWQQDCENEHKLALAKCSLEAEYKMMEMRVQRSKVLVRHKLIKQGVLKEAVDREIPL